MVRTPPADDVIVVEHRLVISLGLRFKAGHPPLWGAASQSRGAAV